MPDLYWHCLQCGDHAPVEPTGGECSYQLGDRERCTECGDGTAVVVTLKIGARYEQGRALGLGLDAAWKRAQGATR